QPLVALYTKPTWIGAEKLPSGGFIAVSNHVTNIDALTFGHFLVGNDVPVKFMAKQELFDTPIVGWVVSRADQIPVRRGTNSAVAALTAAKAALSRGECVGIFPEGTLTRDPDMWPMRGKTGAARLALETGVPVIPIAQWGTQDAIGRYSVRPRWGINWPVTVQALDPVDLSAWQGKEITPQVARAATEKIMADLTAGVANLRGLPVPERVYDMRTDGDPRPPKRKQRRQERHER
ncbi:MAG: lysophospholipid acyltransferase family protein, partial [Bowdeniella nasicola]|nr:lysophospholipid acyltransferase family protein [Bowdeniella nasicola]